MSPEKKELPWRYVIGGSTITGVAIDLGISIGVAHGGMGGILGNIMWAVGLIIGGIGMLLLLLFALFFSWHLSFKKLTVGFTIFIILTSILGNMGVPPNVNVINVKASLEESGGALSVKVFLEGKPNEFVIRLVKSNEYTDWYEQKSVTLEDLVDGSETVWFPLTTVESISEVEVFYQSTGSPIQSAHFVLTSEQIRMIRIEASSGNETNTGMTWPTSGHDWRRSGKSPFVGPQKPRLLWKFEHSPATPFVGPDGTIYFAGYNLYAVNPDGTTKWVFKRRPHELAIAADGTIYFASEGNGNGNWCVFAVNANGKLRWVSPINGETSRSAPAIGPDGTIYAATTFNNIGTSHLYSLASEGTLKWDFPVTGRIEWSPAMGPDGTILLSSYVSSSPGNLYALSPDGKLKWTYPLTGSVAISPDGTIFVIAPTALSALSLDGKLKWQNLDIQGGSTMAVDDDGSAYVGTTNGKVIAVSKDGQIKWTFATKGSHVVQPVVDYDGNLYVGADGDNNLYALDSHGNLKWTFDLGSPMQSKIAIDSNDTIYTDKGPALGSE